MPATWSVGSDGAANELPRGRIASDPNPWSSARPEQDLSLPLSEKHGETQFCHLTAFPPPEDVILPPPKGLAAVTSCICVAFLGMGTFAHTETLLLQTAMFTRCFKWQQYYPLGTMMLFGPGLVIQLAQNKWDKACDARFGSRATSTFRMNAGHIIQLSGLVAFLIGMHHDPEQKKYLLIVSFSFIGIGCSIGYGTCAQLVSIFPDFYQSFFFIGMYSVSIVIGPLQLLIGDLATGSDEEGWEVNWGRTWAFYGVGACFNLLGAISFLVLTYGRGFGKNALIAKDEAIVIELHRAESYGYGASVVSSATSAGSVWVKCIPIGSIMLLALVENLIVCSRYGALPILGDVPSIRLLMMYSFYMSQLVGTLTVMIPAVQLFLKKRVLLGLALLRMIGVWVINSYIDTSLDIIKQGKGIFSSDLSVLIWYTAYQLVGGAIFSRSFTVATSLFESPTDKATAATVMNVIYFAGLVGVSTAVLLIKW